MFDCLKKETIKKKKKKTAMQCNENKMETWEWEQKNWKSAWNLQSTAQPLREPDAQISSYMLRLYS